MTAFLTALEARDLPYIIVARLTPLLRKLVIHRIAEPEWRPVARGIAVADMTASLPVWRGRMRRFVCLRQTLTERPAASGRRLIECPGYTYRVFVTSVPFAAELVTRMYAGRADSENRIKELKEDLSLDTFCLQSFDATDAAFRTGCVLYNLLMGFRETVLPSCWFERRLRAVRDRVFSGRCRTDPPKPDGFGCGSPCPQRNERIFSSGLRTISGGLPIAAQLDGDLCEADDALSSPGRMTSSIQAPQFTPNTRAPPPNPTPTAESGIISPVSWFTKT